MQTISIVIESQVKLQNTRPTICISLNKNSAYCYLPRSIKQTDKCK